MWCHERNANILSTAARSCSVGPLWGLVPPPEGTGSRCERLMTFWNFLKHPLFCPSRIFPLDITSNIWIIVLHVLLSIVLSFFRFRFYFFAPRCVYISASWWRLLVVFEYPTLALSPREKYETFIHNCDERLLYFEFGEVQRNVNLIDLVKRFSTGI